MTQEALGLETLKKKGNCREEDRMLMKQLNKRGWVLPQEVKDDGNGKQI